MNSPDARENVSKKGFFERGKTSLFCIGAIVATGTLLALMPATLLLGTIVGAAVGAVVGTVALTVAATSFGHWLEKKKNREFTAVSYMALGMMAGLTLGTAGGAYTGYKLTEKLTDKEEDKKEISADFSRHAKREKEVFVLSGLPGKATPKTLAA